MTRTTLFLALLLRVSVAEAAVDEPTLPKVPPAEEKEALRLFELGNTAQEEGRKDEAISAYRKALEYWDHPAIHYNLAMVLVNADAGPLECREHLDGAIRYGPRFLASPEMHGKAKELLAKYEAKLARLEVSCEEPGARLMLDWRKEPITCPKTLVEWMLPGSHVVRVDKEGFSHPNEKRLSLKEGAKLVIPFLLYRDEQWLQVRTPLPQWVPWVTMGAGAAALVIGGGIHLTAGGEYRDYDRRIIECAGYPSEQAFDPCSPPVELERRLVQADKLQSMAVGFYIGGGLTVVGGVAGYFLNAPRTYLVDPETGTQVGVAPLILPSGGGAVLTLGF